MLSISNVSAGMAASYFEADDYYTSRDQQVDVFGQAAKSLNIAAKIDHRSFQQLLQGLHPDGHRIVAEKQKNLDPKEVKKAETLFTDRLKKIGLSEQKITYLLEQKEQIFSKRNIAATPEELPLSTVLSLSQEEKKALQGIYSHTLNKWSLEKDGKRKAGRAIDNYLEKLAPTTRRAGTDFTFSAPKSISMAALVGGDKTLEKCHSDAVSYTLKHIENNYIGTRVGNQKSRSIELTGNMIGAKFLHGTSRETDPQLHSHCVVFNMTKRQDGKWRSTFHDEIFKDSKLLGVIYKNKLAELVQKQGYEIKPTGDGSFELKGYTEEQLKAFSKRRSQVLEGGAKLLYDKLVEDNLKEQKIAYETRFSKGKKSFLVQESSESLHNKGFETTTTSNDRRIVLGLTENKSFEAMKVYLKQQLRASDNRAAVMIDRKTKQKITPESLQQKWQAEASNLGIIHPKKGYRFLFGKAINTQMPAAHLGEKRALFSDKKLELAALIMNFGRSTYEKIKEAIDKDITILSTDRNLTVKTNLRQVQLEKAILAMSQKGRGSFKCLGEPHTAKAITSKLKFAPHQRQAFDFTLANTDQFLLWNGVAGSRKSTTLLAVREFAKGQNINVIGLAPDASTAKELGKSIQAKATTVQAFLTKNKLPEGSLIIVDEATRLSTKNMHALMERAVAAKSRVLFVGDYRQFGAVEAGAPFEAMYRSGTAKVDLEVHTRQIDEKLKEAVVSASRQDYGSIENSIKLLSDHIIERKSEPARHKEFIRQYLTMPTTDRDKTLLIADLNHDRRQLTESLRTALKQEGKLGQEEVKLNILATKDLTEAQRKSPMFYQKDDIIIPYETNGRLKANTQYRVVATEGDGLLLANANKKPVLVRPKDHNWLVYKTESIGVSAGDTLEWRRNHEGRINRQAMTVSKVNESHIILRDAAGNPSKIDPKKLHNLDYGLIKTTYSSQGATSDHVIALTTKNVSKESWYVALSRARFSVKIITDDKGKLLARTASKSSKQENAIAYTDCGRDWKESLKEIDKIHPQAYLTIKKSTGIELH